MRKIVANSKEAQSGLLKGWYADSLSLMRPASQNTASQARLITSLWQPSLGILQISAEGKENYASGNSEICRSYISSRNGKKFACPETLVAQFKGGLIITVTTSAFSRIMFLHHDSLANIVHEIAPQANLTKAEFHLLQQILCGLSLRQASSVDNVAYETKRSQFKSLAAHMNFSSQSEVIRNTLLALTNYVFESTGRFMSKLGESPASIKLFLDTYYPGVFRFHQITARENRLLRVLETGPINGTPVIWIHSQTLPSPDQFRGGWAEKNNIRLIIPLRDGFLGQPETHLGKADHLEHATRDIVGTIAYFCNVSARVVANSTGAAYAINLAANYPQSVEHLTISAVAYVGKYENPSIHRMVRGIKNLTLKSEALASKALDRYMSKMSSLTGALELLRTTYDKSPYDMNIFNALLADPHGHAWLYDSYRMSRYSVIKDVSMGGVDVWRDASKITCKPLFIHGRHDPINNVNAARKVAALIKNAEFIELENEGQSLFLQRLADLVTQNPAQWREQSNL